MRTLLLSALFVVTVAVVPTAGAQSFETRTSDFTITANLWFSGDVNIEDYGITVTKNTAFLLKACYDAYLMEKLAMGLYTAYSPATWGDDYTANVFEIGCTIKPRFLVAGGSAAVKPGLSIGYRTVSSELTNVESMQGLAINVGVELQLASTGVIPTIEFGFNTQPVGGNDATGVSWGPIFFVGAGVTF